jgi:putative transposase
MILKTVNNIKYRDLAPCQIVPHLADEGIYIASESSIYRMLRKEKQLKHRGHTSPSKHKKPPVRVADGPNQVWSWDITYLPSQVRGLYFYLYMVMDIYSRKIVGWSIHDIQTSEHAAHLIKQTCLDENINVNQIVLHSDNGSPMKGSTMLAMLEQLGITPSFSRPSVSDDNPFSESLFKTLKYRPDFPLIDKFGTIFDARAWVLKFTVWYNFKHMHSGLKFIPPAQRHNGADQAIIKNRQFIYEQAKKSHPERWSGNTRNWILPTCTKLNPNRKNTTDETCALA